MKNVIRIERSVPASLNPKIPKVVALFSDDCNFTASCFLPLWSSFDEKEWFEPIFRSIRPQLRTLWTFVLGNQTWDEEKSSLCVLCVGKRRKGCAFICNVLSEQITRFVEFRHVVLCSCWQKNTTKNEEWIRFNRHQHEKQSSSRFWMKENTEEFSTGVFIVRHKQDQMGLKTLSSG